MNYFDHPLAIPCGEMKYDMLFEYAKAIGLKGYYRMRNAELVEILTALREDRQILLRTFTRAYYFYVYTEEISIIAKNVKYRE